jgi:hypothetical protein
MRGDQSGTRDSAAGLKTNCAEAVSSGERPQLLDPMHIHLVQFQVFDRTPFDVQLFAEKGQRAASGPPSDPRVTERGRKDTAVT